MVRRRSSPQQLTFDEHSQFAQGDWPGYLRVSEREARAAALRREYARAGRELHPVASDARGITTTFWGRAWCAQLEGYPELAHRLSRARSYVRHGSVVDLVVTAGGRVSALVQGNELYTTTVEVGPTAEERWRTLLHESEGLRAHSLPALLRGELPGGLATVLTQHDAGLLPTLHELRAECTCPDAAPGGVCKHALAALYAVGVLIDDEPARLFALRGVDPLDLVEPVASAPAAPGTIPGDASAQAAQPEAPAAVSSRARRAKPSHTAVSPAQNADRAAARRPPRRKTKRAS